MKAIGVDQAPKLTGLCMGSFKKDGSHEIIRTATVETPGYIAMRDALIDFIGLDRPEVMIAEGAYMGPSAQSHAFAVMSAHWVNAAQYEYNLCDVFRIVPASEWRAKVWPDEGAKMSADWKAFGISEAEKDGIVKPTDHVGDARGLMLYGKIIYLEERNGSEND